MKVLFLAHTEADGSLGKAAAMPATARQAPPASTGKVRTPSDMCISVPLSTVVVQSPGRRQPENPAQSAKDTAQSRRCVAPPLGHHLLPEGREFLPNFLPDHGAQFVARGGRKSLSRRIH